MAFALASSAQLAFLIDWDSDTVTAATRRTWWITGPFLAQRAALLVTIAPGIASRGIGLVKAACSLKASLRGVSWNREHDLK
jgi:hypothetical protein